MAMRLAPCVTAVARPIADHLLRIGFGSVFPEFHHLSEKRFFILLPFIKSDILVVSWMGPLFASPGACQQIEKTRVIEALEVVRAIYN